MGLMYPPARGEVLIGDFNNLFHHEMDKIRPCIVISPKFQQRALITTVVCLSTTPPNTVMSYHGKLFFNPPISPKFNATEMWIKGDMVYTVSLSRLNRPFVILPNRKRSYPARILDKQQMDTVINCVLNGLGIRLDNRKLHM